MPMNTNFDMLDESGKKRIINFSIITVLAAVFAVIGFLIVYWNVNNPQNFLVSEVIDFDGTDFAPFFSFVKAIIVGVFLIFFAVIHLVFAWLIDLLAYILFGELALKKDSFVSNAEYILTKRVFTVILITSIVVSVFIVIINYFIYFHIVAIYYIAVYIALLMVPIWFFGYLFYIRKLKHKRQK